MARMTQKEKYLAEAKKALYDIARGSPDAKKRAQQALSVIANMKYRASLRSGAESRGVKR